MEGVFFISCNWILGQWKAILPAREFSLGKIPVVLAPLAPSCVCLPLDSGDNPSNCFLNPHMPHPTSFHLDYCQDSHVSSVGRPLAASSPVPPEHTAPCRWSAADYGQPPMFTLIFRGKEFSWSGYPNPMLFVPLVCLLFLHSKTIACGFAVHLMCQYCSQAA